MECARDQVLACSGRALDENRTVMWRNALDHGKQLPHRAAGRDHALECRIRGLVSSCACLVPAFCGGKQGRDAFTKLRNLNWLLQVICCTAANCGDRSFGCVMRGHQKHIDCWIEFHNLLED